MRDSLHISNKDPREQNDENAVEFVMRILWTDLVTIMWTKTSLTFPALLARDADCTVLCAARL